MSYNVAICLPPIADNDGRAWAELDSVLNAKGAVPDAFVKLHADLTAKFPCICELPDDREDEGVWCDGPLINNFRHRAAVVGFVYSKVEVGLPFLIATANRHGMIVFDWATDTIHRPSEAV